MAKAFPRPPLVSISTMRDGPMPPGLSQTGMLAIRMSWPLEPAPVAGEGATASCAAAISGPTRPKRCRQNHSYEARISCRTTARSSSKRTTPSLHLLSRARERHFHFGLDFHFFAPNNDARRCGRLRIIYRPSGAIAIPNGFSWSSSSSAWAEFFM